MPIILPAGLRRLDDKEFERVAYRVMEEVFRVHNEFGRLFDERIYQTEIARRLDGARTQVPIEVVFESFRKVYYLDLLYADGAVFELKAADATTDRHRAQLLNYLLLLDLPHGKLVNLRGELAEHEFVNAPWRREERLRFDVDDAGWIEANGGAVEVKNSLVAVLRDWGVGLEIPLYEEALTHFLGGEEKVLQPVEVVVGQTTVGTQVCRLINPDTAFKITALTAGLGHYENHLRQLLAHTALKRIQWINLGRKIVTFRTVGK
jgi:GxxExxY protein